MICKISNFDTWTAKDLVQVNLCQKLLFLHQLTHNIKTDYSIHENSKLRTWGKHVAYRNCFRHSEQFLYTTCSPHVLQKEELLTKIYLYLQLLCNRQMQYSSDLNLEVFILFKGPKQKNCLYLLKSNWESLSFSKSQVEKYWLQSTNAVEFQTQLGSLYHF